MEPAINPSKEIDDPKDFKPSDWVDEEMIDDPEAKKPEGVTCRKFAVRFVYCFNSKECHLKDQHPFCRLGRNSPRDDRRRGREETVRVAF
jgi:hypothetical protein